MPTNLRYVGLDVHAETIAVAVAEPDGEVRPLGIIPNRPDAVRPYPPDSSRRALICFSTDTRTGPGD